MAFVNNKLFNSKIRKTSSLITLYSKKPDIVKKMPKINPLPALGIAVPIDILSYTYTNIHYGENILTPELLTLIGGLGVFTYNYDRLLDVVNNINSYKNPYNKKEVSKYYLNNINYLYPSLIILYGYLTNFFVNNDNLVPFLYIINSTLIYKFIKKQIGEFKAVYIAVCWCAACQILPSIIHDNNYDIINYPLDYIPLFLTLFGYSNLADIKDSDEDKLNGINTIPVKYGDKISRKISFFSILAACFLFGINQNYGDNLLWNNLYQLGNIGYVGSELVVENILHNNNSNVNVTKLQANELDVVFLAVAARMLGI